MLLKPSGKEDKFPKVTVKQAGKTLKINKQSIQGKWAWFSVIPMNSTDNIIITIDTEKWKEQSELWIQNKKSCRLFHILLPKSEVGHW